MVKGEFRVITVKPTIEGDEVKSVEVDGTPLPLQRALKIDEYAEFHQKLMEIAQYINFGGTAGWSAEDIFNFLEWEITDKAHQFFAILTEEGGWVRRDKIQNKMNVKGRALAGILSSPGQYFRRWNRDPLYEMQNRREKNDDKEYPYYRIKKEYLESFKSIFKPEEE